MTNPTPHGQAPEATEPIYPPLPPADKVMKPSHAEPYALWGLKKLTDYAKTYYAANSGHVHKPAEIEHVADDVSKNDVKSNMSTQQPAPATQQAGEVSESQVWRCFHCEGVFTDKDSAALHFGSSERQQAYCTIPAEHFRWMEEQQRRYFEEDTESHRTIRALHSQSFENARRSEERGYARGLEDAKKYPQELGLMVAPHAPTAQAAESVPAGEYPAMPEPFIGVQDRPWGGHAEVIRSAIGKDGVVSCYTANQMRAFADTTHALRVASHGPASQQAVPAVGNSGFDHKTAADFLNGKTVSDEAMRKFVTASRWAHDDRASLRATLQSVRNALASREAEIALLKTALMDAEEAAKQGGAA